MYNISFSDIYFISFLFCLQKSSSSFVGTFFFKRPLDFGRYFALPNITFKQDMIWDKTCAYENKYSLGCFLCGGLIFWVTSILFTQETTKNCFDRLCVDFMLIMHVQWLAQLWIKLGMSSHVCSGIFTEKMWVHYLVFHFVSRSTLMPL